jgi:hypothetical protein
VRIENNGKLLIIGLYGSELSLSNLPGAIPLCFTAWVGIEDQGNFELSGTLHSPSEKLLLSFGAKVKATKSGIGYIPFRFPAVNFNEEGEYRLSLRVVGNEAASINEAFEVKKASQ